MNQNGSGCVVADNDLGGRTLVSANIGGGLGAVCAAILIPSAPICRWLADRHIPVDVFKTEVVTPVVKPRGKLITRQTIRYVRDCREHIDRLMYDGATYRNWLADIDDERPLQGLAST